jgi:N-acetylglucosaminyl-diphospho-decaprenol L-rhamnosyltransferase
MRPAAMPPLKLVVTLVTYNNSAEQLGLFGRAFEIARRALDAGVQVQLLAVDNGEPSSIQAAVPDAHVLPTQGNVGYAPATHRLLEHAFGALEADAVITANPDGAFHHRCLATLVEELRRDDRRLIEGRQFPEEHPKAYDPQSLEVPFASGCCLLIPRTVMREVGNIDPGFWLYLEDVDYSWRVRASGMRVTVCPDALYAHEVVGRPASDFARQQMFLAGRRLGRKWRNDGFTRWCEDIIARDYPAMTARLPGLDDVVPMPPADCRVADFEHAFTFGIARW